MKPSFPTFTVLLISLALLLPMTASQCFAPDGTPANDTPCYPDLPDSFCCGNGYTCMSIKACQGPSTLDEGWYARGTCTSEAWSNAACPTFCRDENYGFLTDIFDCGNGQWCCQREDKSGNACCGTCSLLFDLGIATTVAVVGPTGGLISVATHASSSSSTSSSSLASSSAISSSSPTPTIAISPSPSQTADPSHHSGPSKGTIAGAAVAGILGLAMIVGIGIFAFMRQRRKFRNLKGQIVGQTHSREYTVQDVNGAYGGKTHEVSEMYAVPAELNGHEVGAEMGNFSNPKRKSTSSRWTKNGSRSSIRAELMG